MKVHILQSFPGESKGKTKDLGIDTANSLLEDGTGISAEDGSEHPEPNAPEVGDQGGEDEADSAEKAKSKPGSHRQTKENKEATSSETK